MALLSSDSPQAAEVKAALDELIASATAGEFDILERIYHDDMRIYMFGADGAVQFNDKSGFIKHVTESTEAAVEPNNWAKYHSIEANESEGHVVISRKVNLTGSEQIVTLSIDFVLEDGRWQILREVIRV
ncbi:nuclear transport factor 2 family protein [Pelagibius litoralis]|uniref:Nuclear transport factor 2 family protein n=1 Tax=Pelagibius litoralis TaxID=374515 RepID=A0A967F1P4_9PROT|nr:nuclear transport factor 2 family protein [Pelagibius litoralis]NIA71320.1 nuclear transport factor 2 family protein [Pelagibius litoralis]